LTQIKKVDTLESELSDSAFELAFYIYIFMFPNGALTIFDEITGSGSDLIFDNGSSTVLAVTLSQSEPSNETEIQCGGDTIAKNYATTTYFHALLSAPCEESLTVENDGPGNVSFSIVYVPYLMSETQPHYEPSQNIATSTDISVYGSMSAGEVILSVLLLILIVIELFKTLAQALRSVNSKRKYLAYAGGDVEVIESP